MNFPQNEINCGLLVEAHFIVRHLVFSVDNQLVQTFFTRHQHIRLTTVYGRVQNLLRTFCSIRSFTHEGKEIVVTDGNQFLCAPSQQNTLLLAPCSHEEADSRMMLHVAHADNMAIIGYLFVLLTLMWWCWLQW